MSSGTLQANAAHLMRKAEDISASRNALKFNYLYPGPCTTSTERESHEEIVEIAMRVARHGQDRSKHKKD